MKNIIITLLLCANIYSATAQTQETQQLLLNVEKLAQFKQILSDMKKGYQLLSSGYNTVKDLSQGNFSLHKTFLDALLEVSPAVRKYKRVAEIITAQLDLIKEYKSVSKRLNALDSFSPSELDYTAKVYHRLVTQSLENLDDLTMVITAGKLRMSDNERISEIDRIYLDMQDKLGFLRHFNNRINILALQRAKEQKDVSGIRAAYGLK